MGAVNIAPSSSSAVSTATIALNIKDYKNYRIIVIKVLTLHQKLHGLPDDMDRTRSQKLLYH